MRRVQSGHSVPQSPTTSRRGLSWPDRTPGVVATQPLARARRFCSFFFRAARMRAVFRRLGARFLAGITVSSQCEPFVARWRGAPADILGRIQERDHGFGRRWSGHRLTRTLSGENAPRSDLDRRSPWFSAGDQTMGRSTCSLWRDGRWVHGRGALSWTVMRRTVLPAEGHPAIVTGCAGVSCSVTLVAGVSDCSRAARAAPLPPARSLHCTSTVTQRGCSRQVPSSNRLRRASSKLDVVHGTRLRQKRTRCEVWRVRARTGCHACVKDALPGCSVPPIRALTRPRPPRRTPRRPFHRGRPRSAGVGRPPRVRKT